MNRYVITCPACRRSLTISEETLAFLDKRTFGERTKIKVNCPYEDCPTEMWLPMDKLTLTL